MRAFPVHGLCIGLAFFLSLAAGCATPSKPSVHVVALSGAPEAGLPRKVLLIPPDVRVSEISVGGVVEKVDAWSEQAKSHVIAGIRELARSRGMFEFVDPPELAADQQTALEQHVALYDVVAQNAFAFGRLQDPAWAHKAAAFDYTLGPGLAFLAQESGADAALFLVGADQVSSAGRKAAMFVAALAGVAIPAGVTYFSAGLVDLKTGALLWFNYDFSVGAMDMRQAADVAQILAQVFKDYPAGPK